MNFILKCF